MTFYKKGYRLVRSIIDKDEVIRLYNHLNQRNDGDMNDIQMVGTPSFYNDPVMQKVQKDLLPKIEMYTGLELFKTYTYARVYKKHDVLRIHLDRPACEISLTMHLGGDEWPIWILDRDENPVKVDLNPGDVLIYRGCDIKHWRGKFEQDTHTQAFMHYVDKYGSSAWAIDDIKKQP
jgi:hypothetical protein